MASKIPEHPPVYQLKITMAGIRPLICRRILVSSDVKLYKLHKILQAVMGWKDYHLHLFTVDDVFYAYPSPDDPWPMKTKNERRARLSDVVPNLTTNTTWAIAGIILYWWRRSFILKKVWSVPSAWMKNALRLQRTTAGKAVIKTF